MTGITFGCGEFVPGGEPITVGDIKPTSPTVLVPADKPIGDEIPPFIPPTNPIPKFACLQISPGQNPPPPPPGFRYKNGFYQKCYPCDGALNKTGIGPAIHPSINDPRCVYLSIPDCQPNCLNPLIPIEDPPLEPPPGGGNGGGGVVQFPGGSTGGGPTTGGGSRFYKCRQTLFICPQDVEEPNPRITSIQHNCIVCNNFEPNGGTGLSSTGPPKIVGSNAVQNFETGCVYTSKDECDNKCPPGPITARIVPNCLDPVSVVPVNSSEPNIPVSKINIAQVEPNSQGPNTSVVNRIFPAAPSLNEPNPSNNSNIFHNTYNFFSQKQSLEPVTFAPNYSYPTVFKPTVAAQVSNLMSNEGSQAAWRESTLFSLNLGQIEASLDPELLTAFEVIHRPGGQLVGKDVFLQMVRKHLLTGTMSEFDADHYKTLARRQINDKRIQYTGLSDKDINARASLGLVGQDAVVVDATQLTNINKRQIRRQRRFNTDVNARVTVLPLEDPQEQEMPLTDSGINVVTKLGSNISVPTGPGDGYYMTIEQLSEMSIPLVTTSDFSSTFYVPAETRYNALSLLGEDTAYTLAASASPGNNEFVSGDAGASELKPLYLKLDLESVAYEPNANPLVSRYKGTYNVEGDLAKIEEHTKDNGLAVTRINIDYRDPIYRYILDSNKATIALNDINFKTILNPKDYPGGVRIARNIPFGLVITPVAGSKFNPFNGVSELAVFEQDPFVRELRLLQDIDISDSEPVKPDLEEKNLYLDTGGDLKVGLAEPDDSQNVVYKYDSSNPRYTNTFYRDGQYTTSADPVSSYGISYMLREVIDYIVDTHNPGTISWYDVFRRMPLNKVGEFLYSTNPRIINELERGFRRGLNIQSVISSANDLTSLILADDSKTIIKEGDR